MKNDALIQGYLQQRLSAEQLKQFESLLSSNLDFKKDFEMHRDLHEAIKYNEAAILKKRLKNLENNPSNTKKVNKYWYSVAASILIFGLAYTFYTTNYSNDFDGYFDVYPNVYNPIVRGGQTDASTNAFEAYEAEDYETAEREFISLLKESQNLNLEFYLAMSLINQKKIDQAQTLLKSLQNQKFEFVNESQWYLALIYLKKDNSIEAKKILMSLDTANISFKSKERKLLLQKLNAN